MYVPFRYVTLKLAATPTPPYDSGVILPIVAYPLKDNPDIQDKVLGKKKRYFNFLMSPKRGKKQLNATNALKKIIREDGTELTLDQLAKRYPNAN